MGAIKILKINSRVMLLLVMQLLEIKKKISTIVLLGIAQPLKFHIRGLD
jgi:hypothetical protein